MDEPGIELEDGWHIIESRGFQPLAQVLDVDGDFRRRHGVDGPKNWNEIYTTVYKLCIQKVPGPFAKELYFRVQNTLKTYLRQSALPSLKSTQGEEAMLKELSRRWKNHKLMVKWVTRTFSYIDRYYVPRNDEPTLENAGYMCFKKEIFDTIARDVRDAALHIVRRERSGESIDRSLLKEVLEIFVEMGMGKLDVYTAEWETPFLEDTGEFYRRTSATWAEEDSFPDFMIKADTSIMAELDRAGQYLNPQTQERLLRVCEKEVLINHQTKMLEKENSGLVALLRHNKTDDLQRLFRLYSRVPYGLVPVGQILKKHIQKEGMELVREHRARYDAAKAPANTNNAGSSSRANTVMTDVAASSPSASSSAISPVAGNSSSDKPDFIQGLLALHDRYLRLVSTCFSKHIVFNKAMKEAFERFVNEQVGDCSTAQLFANYCDSLLSTSGRGAKMPEPQVEAQLTKLVKLFTFLSEKDIFQEFCKKQLSKRLLMDKSHSDELERFLIQKLKESCGSHFTSKLEGMITDMSVSKDIQKSFQKWHISESIEEADSSDQAVASNAPQTAIIEGAEFNVRVLTTSNWPSYAEDSIILPPQLKACEQRFQKYYDIRTSQRVLRWVPSLGKSTVETTLFTANNKKGDKKIELHVSTYQLCILILFNNADEVTYGQVLANIQLKKPEKQAENASSAGATSSGSKNTADGEDLIKASLVSLMSKRYPLLTKEPKGREFKETDKFKLNFKYVSPKRRLNIPTPTAKISEEEKEAAHETVVEDRRHAIEAAIVRVMKRHKTLEHQQLIMEVSKLCNPVFQPEPRAIKNRIEELISREYLAREEGSNSKYKYLA